MTKTKFAIIILVLSLQSFSQSEKMNIAVMELEGNGVSKSDLGGLSNRLRTELFKTYKFNVIERSRMDEILKEQGFQQAGCANSACAVEVGRLIGVEMIIIGNVDYVGTIYSADIRMVNVETGKIEKVATDDCEDCSINDVLKTTIQNVTVEMAGLKIKKRKVKVKSRNKRPKKRIEKRKIEKKSLKKEEPSINGVYENEYFILIDYGLNFDNKVGNEAWFKIKIKKDMKENSSLFFDCLDSNNSVIKTRSLFIDHNLLATMQKTLEVYMLPQNIKSIGNLRFRFGVVDYNDDWF